MIHSQTKEIPIVFSTDNNYVIPTGVAILSLLESAKPSTVYRIFILINDDVTEESKNQLRTQVSYFPKHTVEFIKVGRVFENSFEIRNISTATYSRLLIPWLIPQYDKIIFSDVDVIFRIDLTDVYNIDMENKYVAGVLAYGFRFNRKIVKHLTENKLNPNEYIQAGFLVINAQLQREQDLRVRYLEESSKKYLFQDMDIINIVCQGYTSILSQAYCIAGPDYSKLLSNNPQDHAIYKDKDFLPKEQNNMLAVNNYKRGKNCILHYAGKKPWNDFTYAWKEWWNTYQRSIFYDPDNEIKVSQSILNPIPTWKSIALQIKKKIVD